jgi:hypothetical protein
MRSIQATGTPAKRLSRMELPLVKNRAKSNHLYTFQCAHQKNGLLYHCSLMLVQTSILNSKIPRLSALLCFVLGIRHAPRDNEEGLHPFAQGIALTRDFQGPECFCEFSFEGPNRSLNEQARMNEASIA